METVFKYSQIASKRKHEGFITETPLNMIQTTKMVMNPTYSNNPLINYKKNIINSQKISKKFSVTQNHTNETNSFVNFNSSSEIKSEDSENNEKLLLKAERNKKNIRFIKPINICQTRDYFIKKGQKTDRSNQSNNNFILEKRPCTEKSNFRLCKPLSKVVVESQQSSKEINFNKPQDNKIFKTLKKNLYLRTEESGKSDNLFLEKDKKTEFLSNIKDLEMPQINMFGSNTNPEIQNQKIHSRQSMALKSPLNMTTPEEFKDLDKLELRRKIFRKFSLTKREKKPFVQTISLEEPDTLNIKNNEETDLKYYMEKREEFEGFYEEDLYKIGYFNDNHDGDKYSFLDRNKKGSNLIQRDMNGTFKNSILQMKRIFKNEMEAGTAKLYEKYFSENNENYGKNKNDSFLRGFFLFIY